MKGDIEYMAKGELTKELLQSQKEYIDECLGRSQCESCLHYEGGNICKVFPDGIPLEIISDERRCYLWLRSKGKDAPFIAEFQRKARA